MGLGWRVARHCRVRGLRVDQRRHADVEYSRAHRESDGRGNPRHTAPNGHPRHVGDHSRHDRWINRRGDERRLGAHPGRRRAPRALRMGSSERGTAPGAPDGESPSHQSATRMAHCKVAGRNCPRVTDARARGDRARVAGDRGAAMAAREEQRRAASRDGARAGAHRGARPVPARGRAARGDALPVASRGVVVARATATRRGTRLRRPRAASRSTGAVLWNAVDRHRCPVWRPPRWRTRARGSHLSPRTENSRHDTQDFSLYHRAHDRSRLGRRARNRHGV